mgnify:CR=1 FL=1
MMRKWHVLTLGLLIVGGLLLMTTSRPADAGIAKGTSEVRRLSDSELARAVGGSPIAWCCDRYSGVGPGPGGVCASVAPAPAPIPGGAAGCIVAPNSDACDKSIATKECAYDKTAGPAKPDVCALKSKNVADICNPTINGWCEQYNRRVCTSTVNGCECKDFGGATTGTRATCDYTNAAGVHSAICP